MFFKTAIFAPLSALWSAYRSEVRRYVTDSKLTGSGSKAAMSQSLFHSEKKPILQLCHVNKEVMQKRLVVKIIAAAVQVIDSFMVTPKVTSCY